MDFYLLIGGIILFNGFFWLMDRYLANKAGRITYFVLYGAALIIATFVLSGLVANQLLWGVCGILICLEFIKTFLVRKKLGSSDPSKN